jgi:DnaB-like helicase C terminal domain
LDETLADSWLWLPDPDEPGATFERVVEQAKKRGPVEGRPMVYLIDSAQTVKSSAGNFDDGEREQIKALISAARLVAKRDRAIVIICSQINRSGFRNKKKSDNTIELASFTGSSAIEYGCDLAIALDGEPETAVSAYLAKNRLGAKKARFHLRFDPQTATFAEMKEGDVLAERDLGKAAKAAEAARVTGGKILKKLVKATDGFSTRQLFEAVGGSRAAFDVAREALEEAGQIASAPGSRGALIWRKVAEVEADPGFSNAA